MRTFLGASLIALPFLALFAFIAITRGWFALFAILAVSAIIVLPIMAGVNLLNPPPKP